MIEKYPKEFKENEPLLSTITGELYQPLRIYYQVRQRNAVLGRFKRLRCMSFDKTEKSWLWLYGEEGKNISLRKSYREITKEKRPVILGSFTWRGEVELRLDVCSIERGIEALKFFDQKINRRLAKFKKLKIVNKLFSASLSQEEMASHSTFFFEECLAVNLADNLDKLETEMEKLASKTKKKNLVVSEIVKQMKEKSPEVEELEAPFYEDGIEAVSLLLAIRQMEAKEHWKGNEDFSKFDIIEALMEKAEDEKLWR